MSRLIYVSSLTLEDSTLAGESGSVSNEVLVYNEGFVKRDHSSVLCFSWNAYFADINECSDRSLNNCQGNSSCEDKDGSYACKCLPGFNEVADKCLGMMLVRVTDLHSMY